MFLSQAKEYAATNRNPEQSPLEYKLRLVHATRQNHPDETVEMAFAVTDPQTGQEKIITCENLDARTLFELTEEGTRWLGQQKSNVRGIRRAA